MQNVDRDVDRDAERGSASRSERPVDTVARSERDQADDDIVDVDDDAAGTREGPRTSGDSDSTEHRKRRRRRGRRGGRRRRGTEGGGDEGGRPEGLRSAESRAGAPSDGSRGDGDHEDEPLPTAYGMPARRAGERPRSDESRGDAAGGERSRRRRRRGGRRRAEKPGEERAPASKSRSRGSRRDFAPVAGSFDEDDEGLEFLGLEESTQSKPRGDAAADDQDVLAESGLADVLDVPSWVEAIGIVIAGNLDARSRSREDRHR